MKNKKIGLLLLLATLPACGLVYAGKTTSVVPKQDVVNTGLKSSPVQVGDVFVYDNPVERWEVVHVGDGTIDWHNANGGYKKTTWSTVLPSLRWQSNVQSGARELNMVSGTVHPLAVGKKFVFSDKALHFRPPKSFTGLWRCEVTKEIEIAVVAGKAKTWQILCSLNEKEKVMINYADNLGGAVRMIMLTDGGDTIVRQLTGYASNKSQSEKISKK